ncbi:MAG TPA: aminoglycoside phosphotransferase family protein [Candidatus Alistipes stercorigallinarum]|nr:aminoglycoside phosphotransferase family protein [Candidatus Alistipes stercorigallinarum]
MNDRLVSIASQFALEGEILDITPVGEGFINDTYRIHTVGSAPDYILQRKNGNIFKDVPAMMENIRKVTEHIRRKVIAAGGDPDREVMRVIPTRTGRLCHRDEGGEHWAATLFIDDTVTYDRADSPALARMGGIGIGHFQSQLADFDEPLAETIPGFHDIRHRFAQWDRTLSLDAAGRCREAAEEIGWIEARRDEMLAFWRLVEEGSIPRHVTHNDTKISNFLFDRQGNVLCVIDLDTVMNSTSLNDFGDAIRTYANTGAEDDRDLARVGMSMEFFTAYTDGYLSQHARELSEAERAYLAFSARYITYEQVLRFLMDYLDGDTYYKIRSADHNLVRTRAQYRLLRSMEEQYGAMCEAVRELNAKYNR